MPPRWLHSSASWASSQPGAAAAVGFPSPNSAAPPPSAGWPDASKARVKSSTAKATNRAHCAEVASFEVRCATLRKRFSSHSTRSRSKTSSVSRPTLFCFASPPGATKQADQPNFDRTEQLMLSPQSTEVIRATLPVVGAAIGDITTLFYRRMFDAHPELERDLFNRGKDRKSVV